MTNRLRHILPNGLTILSEDVPGSRSLSLAIVLRGGSGDETNSELGITHLLEHLLFRRTKSRTNKQIAALMDELGGDVNAYTDTESIALVGSVPADRAEDLLQLFSDMLLEAAFNESDLKLEKDIIAQEILEAQDDPIDVLTQEFSECFWLTGALAKPVFGTIKSVPKLSLKMTYKRIKAMLCGKRILIGAAGNINFDLTTKIAALFGSLPSGEAFELKIPKSVGSGQAIRMHPSSQCYLALGIKAPGLKHEDFIATNLLSMLLGEGSSSRLFQKVREDRGLAYSLFTFLDSYSTRSAFVISGTFNREEYGDALNLIAEELRLIREGDISEEEFSRARSCFRAQVLLASESLSTKLWRLIETEIIFGRYIELEEVLVKLDNVNLKHLIELSHQILKPKGWTAVTVGDVKGFKYPKALERLCS